MKRFQNKRVLITGAGSGLGKALALEFAEMGWKVAIAEINQERSKETADIVNRKGGQSLEISCDVTKPEDLENAAERVKEKWGGIDIIVNNAGVSAAGFFEKIPLDKWEWIIDINLKSIIYGCRAFIPMLKEQGEGYIVNTASSMGIASLPEMASYNMTKAGVISLSETLRLELAPHNIGVSVICPAFFKTNLMDQFTSTDERQRILAEAFFSKSTVTAEKIARHVIRSIRKKRFYIITQFDGKLMWYAKRYFPELYFKTASYIYRSKLFEKFLGVSLQVH
jgi:NAD(P)-dependent dehydrogenase (short-subunit alcohol dehydrogenase family)